MIAKKLRTLLKPPADVTGETSARPRTRVRTRRSSAEEDAAVHPWRELTVRDDRIVLTRAGTETDYLATPEIRIVAKKEAIADTEGGRASYTFKLNAAPDLFWRHRFAKNLEQLPDGINRSDLRVDFKEDMLVLMCMPSRLEAKYACVKANVARTNEDYRHERDLILRRLREEAGGNGRGNRKADIVQRRFDRLEL